MTHLTRDELMAWRDAPAPDARERVVGHLAACDRCAALYAELIRTSGPAGAPAHFDPEVFASRGHGVLVSRPGRVLVVQRKLFIPLAAAAAIILAIWLPASRRVNDEAGDAASVMRGSRPEAVAPAGDTNGPIAFQWTSPAPAVRYAIEVKDAAGRRVFYRETREERIPADAAIDAAIRPGDRFTWTVTALDGAGEVVGQSLPRAFTRRPAPSR